MELTKLQQRLPKPQLIYYFFYLGFLNEDKMMHSVRKERGNRDGQTYWGVRFSNLISTSFASPYLI